MYQGKRVFKENFELRHYNYVNGWVLLRAMPLRVKRTTNVFYDSFSSALNYQKKDKIF